jgi:hypothetical protein
MFIIPLDAAAAWLAGISPLPKKAIVIVGAHGSLHFSVILGLDPRTLG